MSNGFRGTLAGAAAAAALVAALSSCASVSHSSASRPKTTPAATSTPTTASSSSSSGSGGAVGVPVTSGSSPAAVATCTPSVLSLALVHGGVAAGTLGVDLRLTNRGAAPCSVAGWPTVRGMHGTRAGAPARHVRQALDLPEIVGVPETTLRTGESAVAVLAAADEPGPSGRCAAPYDRLAVTLPASSATVTISARVPDLGSVPACARLAVTLIIPTSDVPTG